MNALEQMGPLQLISVAILVSGLASAALFGQTDFGLILVAVSAFLAYVYQAAWQQRGMTPPGSTSRWQQGKFIAGQLVSHFGREARVVAVPVRVVPRNHIPVSYTDERGCFATVPWSELQHPRHAGIETKW